jgi:hypothetical protein
MALLGGTTWVGLQQPIARDPARNVRLTAIGIRLCLVTGLVALLVVAVTLPDSRPSALRLTTAKSLLKWYVARGAHKMIE